MHLKNKRILIFGGSGMVGSAIAHKLINNNRVHAPSHKDCDLLNYDSVKSVIRTIKPNIVFMAAGMVGGLQDNAFDPITYCHNNAMMGLNVVKACHESTVHDLVYYSSSCVYPRNAHQPFKECDINNGHHEPTNEGYALAKIITQKQCEFYNRLNGYRFRTLISCNLYGPGDKFDLQKGHVVGSLIKRFVDAKKRGHKTVYIWGDGTQRREIMHVNDLVRATIHIVEEDKNTDPINVGVGFDISIKELAQTIAHCVDYNGKIKYDTSKPVGMPAKLLDVSKLNELGWTSMTTVENGIKNAISHYKGNS